MVRVTFKLKLWIQVNVKPAGSRYDTLYFLRLKQIFKIEERLRSVKGLLNFNGEDFFLFLRLNEKNNIIKTISEKLNKK